MNPTISLPSETLVNEARPPLTENRSVASTKLDQNALGSVPLNPLGGAALLDVNWQRPLGYALQNPAPTFLPSTSLAGIAKLDRAACDLAAECMNSVALTEPQEGRAPLYRD